MKRFLSFTLTCDAALFALVAALLFWRLGTYPGWFDSVVGFAIFPQVNHVLDGVPLDQVTWRWEDMYQHNAGLSPVYSALQVASLSQFGLSLFAVRFPVALVSWCSLLAGFAALQTLVGRKNAQIFILLVATLPWYLVLARSGGILALNLALYLFIFAALVGLARVSGACPNHRPLFQEGRADPLLGFGIGLLVGLLPYVHISIRIHALLLLFAVPLFGRVFSLRSRLGFVAGVTALLSLQFTDLSHAFGVYFEARGEGIWHISELSTDGSLSARLQWLWGKMGQNFADLCGQLLGYANAPRWFTANQADSYWHPKTVLLPIWMAPFLITGLCACVIQALRKKSQLAWLLLCLLALGMLPGILAGDGAPNLARSNAALFPLIGVVVWGGVIATEMVRRSSLGTGLVILSLAVAGSAQTYNYFGYEKGTIDDMLRDRTLHAGWLEFRAHHNDAVLVLHEFSDFYLESYVTLRWLGGQALQTELDAGDTLLGRSSDLEKVEAATVGPRPVFILSRNPDEAEKRFGPLGFQAWGAPAPQGDFQVYFCTTNRTE